MLLALEKGLAVLLALLLSAAVPPEDGGARDAQPQVALRTPGPEDGGADAAVGEPVPLAQGLTITLVEYDTIQQFRYYPAGGYSATTLLAKAGYSLLRLKMAVANETPNDVYVATLLDATLSLGEEYTAQARHLFFYLAQPDLYTGGLRCVESGATVEGCLLFAVPDSIETSAEPLVLRLDFAGAAYTFTLREGEAP